MNHIEKARQLFLSGCNCSQAVFTAFEDIIGLDRDTMIRLSAVFGGGGAGMRETCGAVSGMMLVMGYLTATTDYSDVKAKSALYKRFQGMTAEFDARFGTHQCGELLKLVKGFCPDPSERTEEYYKSRPCVLLVEEAARIVDQALNEGKTTEA